MTEQKSLKRLVRSRMERTGESYTTARRHVLANAPRSAGGGLMHDSALLRNALGDGWSEAMLAGLAGGIGFMYFVFEYKELKAPTMTIVARHHPDPFIPAALRNAGIEHQVTTTGSVRKAEKALREATGTVICTVDRTKLPWHGLTGEWGPEPYPVGVQGLDGDTVLVDDECLQPNPLPLADFLAAWGKKHEMITIGAATGKPDVRTAVSTTVAHLTGPVLGNNFDVNFGFSGMRKLAAEMRDVKGKKGWSQRWATPGAEFFVLRRLHDCLEVEYTAPSATRQLYADFLREAGLPGVTEFEAAGRIWSDVAARSIGAMPVLQEYEQLVTERMRLMISGGAAVADEVRALGSRMSGLAERATPVQAGLYVELADLVDEARELEEKAVGQL